MNPELLKKESESEQKIDAVFLTFSAFFKVTSPRKSRYNPLS